MTDPLTGAFLVVAFLAFAFVAVQYITDRRDRAARAARAAVKQRDYYHSPAAQRLRAIHDGVLRP